MRLLARYSSDFLSPPLGSGDAKGKKGRIYLIESVDGKLVTKKGRYPNGTYLAPSN